MNARGRAFYKGKRIGNAFYIDLAVVGLKSPTYIKNDEVSEDEKY